MVIEIFCSLLGRKGTGGGILLILIFFLFTGRSVKAEEKVKFFSASDAHLQYVGRIDFSNPELPRAWAPGVYMRAAFWGRDCEIVVKDQVLYDKFHNYISVVVDGGPPRRIKLTKKNNRIRVAQKLNARFHTLLICKSTESNIGYIEFAGIYCVKLKRLPLTAGRKIEFIGNSITCGTGSDVSAVPCGKGEWFDQHNAYMSYGPVTARDLGAQWQLTSYSGIGLVQSCCNLKVVMPQIFDKINMLDNQIPWDFNRYQPDVITVCLGQNDGIQDSAVFCHSYLDFIRRIRYCYPDGTIICLSSPMADDVLLATQKRYLNAIVAEANRNDPDVYSCFFSRRYHNGCGDHPDLSEHRQIAGELSRFIRKVKHW